MSGELRYRIERQLCMFFDEGYDGHLFDAAQAIIDDLGLEVETLSEKAIGHMVRPAQYRVVGKWVAHP